MTSSCSAHLSIVSSTVFFPTHNCTSDGAARASRLLLPPLLFRALLRRAGFERQRPLQLPRLNSTLYSTTFARLFASPTVMLWCKCPCTPHERRLTWRLSNEKSRSVCNQSLGGCLERLWSLCRYRPHGLQLTKMVFQSRCTASGILSVLAAQRAALASQQVRWSNAAHR